MTRWGHKTIAFTPDASGWRVVAEWHPVNPDDDADLELYIVPGWLTQQQREFQYDGMEVKGAERGPTRVIAAIFDPEGGYELMPMDYLNDMANRSKNVGSVQLRLLAPDIPTPDGLNNSRPV